MKLFHTLATLDPSSGGPARSVPQLALALAERGHEVAVWSPDRGARTREGVESEGSDSGGQIRGVSGGGFVADIDRELAEGIRVLGGPLEAALEAFGRPDLAHDHGIWLPGHRRLAKVCGERMIPRIVSPRGMLEPWALRHKRWKKRLAWWLYQRRDLQSAHGLHATAEQEASQMRELGLRAPIVVAANGVSSPRTMSGDFDRMSTIHDLGLPKTALFLSRVHQQKGLPMWLEAWKRVRPDGWRMRVIGPEEDGHRAALQSIVKRAGLAESWSFEEALEGQAKWRAMADADLFVLPSHSENFGIVVAEALACGTPVITTTGTPWAGLREHDCGWWVEPTVDGLEKGFREALARVGEYPQMGARGGAWVEREFAWPGIAAKMESAYEWWLDQGPKPDCVI